MFKKIMKILIILVTLILVIIVGDYIYLEVRISMEKARIEEGKRNEFIIDDYSKIEVTYKLNADDWTNLSDQAVKYCIDLDKNLVERKLSVYQGEMPYDINFKSIWIRKRLELEKLKDIRYNEVTHKKLLSEEEKQQLEQLISKICNGEINSNREDNSNLEENNKGLFYAAYLSGEYRITTKDKKNVLMDNIEDKKLFLKLVE